MCEFCLQHGEGKKWYLNVKNYEKELWHGDNDKRIRFTARYHQTMEDNMVKPWTMIDDLREKDPGAERTMLDKMVREGKKVHGHWPQIVPIEDALKIIDFCTTITRIPCVCRWLTKGVKDARFCYMTTRTPEMLDPIAQFPDFEPPSDLENLTKKEVKESLIKHDQEGLVHEVATFGTPFVGGICNCSVQECLVWGTRRSLGSEGWKVGFKGEYVATIDIEKCNGCRECMKSCNFGAITYSHTVEKSYVHQTECHGCGVCRARCKNNAITLMDRNAIPSLANDW